jgi:hypothetical protein
VRVVHSHSVTSSKTHFDFRYAKRKIDDFYFYGKYLSVSYLPEYETLTETEEKLKDRMMNIHMKTEQSTYKPIYLLTDTFYMDHHKF